MLYLFMKTTKKNSKTASPGKVFALIVLAIIIASLRSEEHTSELQSQSNLVCRLLLEKKKTTPTLCTARSPGTHPESLNFRRENPLHRAHDPYLLQQALRRYLLHEWLRAAPCTSVCAVVQYRERRMVPNQA